MPTNATRATYVIGHRNPDADAICSAIAYASLKTALGQAGYQPARCGNTNARIDAILSRFGQSPPLFLGDVSPRVKDIMVRSAVATRKGATFSEALKLIDQHDIRALPVLAEDGKLDGYVSIFQMGDYFIPKFGQPKAMRHVYTSINDVVRSLDAEVKFARDPDTLEDMYVKIGAMDIRSFGKFSASDQIPASQTVIIVGDRWDIQQRSIQIGVRLLVVTGNLDVEEEALEMAKEKGVSLIVSPFDSATTAWTIRAASKIDPIVDADFDTFRPSERLAQASRRIASAKAPLFMVTEESGKLAGIFTKTDILKPPPTRLVLVDHNELGQAVPGAGEVEIAEVIDHHRLGSINTDQPILFINEPVGSTCTIVAGLFRSHRIEPEPEIAGVMLGGIISDTLNLTSPTTAEKDREIVRWLEGVAGVKADALAEEIFSSGSVILELDPDAVIRADQKLYEESGARFSVSQVEELGFRNFWERKPELAEALERFVKQEGLHFGCLLVTDINRHNSLLLVKGSEAFVESISYPAVEKGLIYDLAGVVSRKKQLIPFISSLLKNVHLGQAGAASGR